MKKIIIMLVAMLCMPLTFAAYFYDSFDDGILNWTSSGFVTEDAVIGAIYSTFPYDSQWVSKDFGAIGFNFNESMEINVSVGGSTGSNYQFNQFAITDGDTWETMTNYITFTFNEDADNEGGYDDLLVACAGSCVCTYNKTDDLNDVVNHSATITYDVATGFFRVLRNDSMEVSTYISGCDISQWNVTLYTRGDNNTFFYDFAITDGHTPLTCTPNWTCDGYGICLPNSTQVCNSVIDLNACGEVYGGDYSEFPAQNCSYITGYVAQYSQSDLDNIVSDGLGTGGAIIVAFIPIIIIGGVVIYGYKLMKRSRK